MEKFEKDKLATENFIKDFKTVFLETRKQSITSLAFAIPISVMLIYGVIAAPLSIKLFLGPFSLICFLSIYSTFYHIIKIYITYKTVSNQSFEIVIDTVIDKKEERARGLYTSGNPNTLIFHEYGNYSIPECVNYSSSKQFSMRETEVFKTTEITDEFYLIINQKKRVILAYNMKFFKLKNN